MTAQPPARPTASDIAKFADANMTPEAKIKSDTAQPPAREDALRAAVEALEKIKNRTKGSDCFSDIKFAHDVASEALTTLQAEQKGGAK